MKAFVIALVAVILMILIATWIWELVDTKKPPKKSEFQIQKELYWKNMERFGFTPWEIDRAFEDIKNLEELKRVNKEMVESVLKHNL